MIEPTTSIAAGKHHNHSTTKLAPHENHYSYLDTVDKTKMKHQTYRPWQTMKTTYAILSYYSAIDTHGSGA